ncbi:BZIP domain-containing protein [Mycena chlorophos]|uniref:BZIP domain-containing protein n=1 Tax=Mycena chlorophos TaxID=658473 RepID=A0A8H6TIJ8_MYCCL|nr:BZIP domain-containing protein [Mycena chlorophos]
MLVDNPIAFAPPSLNDYTQEFSDFVNLDLFTVPNSAPSPASSGSRESTPHLQTPPQVPPATSFPDVHDPSASPNELFSFLDEEVKALDPLQSFVAANPYNLFSTLAGASSGGGGGRAPTEADITSFLSIDPQLVDSPAALSSLHDFDSDSHTSPASAAAASPEEPALIVPVKVGGHGKARKGTVVGGGVAKKQPVPSSAHKENTVATAIFPTAASTFRPKPTGAASSSSKMDDDEDDEDDVPADWRPPPEVFAKMTSKEKRQLRNKISARNFRIRRKEYITTLEDNIAERDRLLEAIRAELGSTQSENVALRQEIATLKRTLLENRGPAPVLPPPGPLPVTASPIASSSSNPLPKFKIDKDLDMSGQRFWGGVSPLGGNITSVHTARIPELLGANPFADSPFAKATGQEPAQVRLQQENMNPHLNPTGQPKVSEVVRAGLGFGAGLGTAGDIPFTMRSLDTHRMQLWGTIAQQYKLNKEKELNQNNASPFASSSTSASNSPISNPSPFAGNWKATTPPQSPPFGLAGRMGPKYFSSYPSASSSSSSSSANSLINSLAGLSLSGKPSGSSLSQRQREKERETIRDQEAAMYAAMASQTLVKRLGSAFWDAFSGHDRPAAKNASAGANATPSLDTEKVRKVLEGRAVVRVVDVEPQLPPPAPAPVAASASARCTASASMGLAECFQGLSLGKKVQDKSS